MVSALLLSRAGRRDNFRRPCDKTSHASICSVEEMTEQKVLVEEIPGRCRVGAKNFRDAQLSFLYPITHAPVSAAEGVHAAREAANTRGREASQAGAEHACSTLLLKVFMIAFVCLFLCCIPSIFFLVTSLNVSFYLIFRIYMGILQNLLHQSFLWTPSCFIELLPVFPMILCIQIRLKDVLSI